MSDSDRTRSVGDVSAASGVTVRTLHHWDAIGLLSPSSRTSAGHRLYTQGDLSRLYHVLTLRSLGLPLGRIAACLDGDEDPVRLLRDHRAALEATLAALQEACSRLAGVESELADDREPTVETLMAAVRSVDTGGSRRAEVLRRYLDDEQIDTLRRHASAMAEDRDHALQIEWPELYRRAESLRASGRPPSDRRVRRLVERMDELSEQFNGGDGNVSASVKKAWRCEPTVMSGQRSPATKRWEELSDYLDQARERSAP